MRRTADRRNGDGGFGLVELLATIAVAGVLLGLALPSLGRLTGESRIGALSNDLVGALQTARSEAIKRAGPVAACASADPLAAAPACDSTDWTTGWIVYADADPAGHDAADPLILQREGAGPDATIVADASVASRVRFDAEGAHVLDTGAPFRGGFTLGAGGETRRVTVAASGRVTAARP